LDFGTRRTQRQIEWLSFKFFSQRIIARQFWKPETKPAMTWKRPFYSPTIQCCQKQSVARKWPRSGTHSKQSRGGRSPIFTRMPPSWNKKIKSRSRPDQSLLTTNKSCWSLLASSSMTSSPCRLSFGTKRSVFYPSLTKSYKWTWTNNCRDHRHRLSMLRNQRTTCQSLRSSTNKLLRCNRSLRKVVRRCYSRPWVLQMPYTDVMRRDLT